MFAIDDCPLWYLIELSHSVMKSPLFSLYVALYHSVPQVGIFVSISQNSSAFWNWQKVLADKII